MIKIIKALISGIIAFLISYNGRQAVYAVVMNAIAGMIAYFTLVYAIELSAFGIGMLKYTIAISFWILFDIFVLHSVDTMEELKKGNIAIATVFAGYLIGAAIVIGYS